MSEQVEEERETLREEEGEEEKAERALKPKAVVPPGESSVPTSRKIQVVPTQLRPEVALKPPALKKARPTMVGREFKLLPLAIERRELQREVSMVVPRPAHRFRAELPKLGKVKVEVEAKPLIPSLTPATVRPPSIPALKRIGIKPGRVEELPSIKIKVVSKLELAPPQTRAGVRPQAVIKQDEMITPPTRNAEAGVSRVSIGGESGKAEPELEPEDIIGKLFPKGVDKLFSFQRPLCIIAVGETADGLKMLEHLISTKYTYHGEYRFSMSLPWQREEVQAEITERKLKKTGVKQAPASEVLEVKEEKPYSLITSKDLIVRIPSANERNKAEIIRGLREISKRGPKCVILYTQNAEPFENLNKEVPDIDVLIITLPEYNERLPRLIEKLLGIDLPPHSSRKVDDLWGYAVWHYEEELRRLDRELPTKGVDFFPERESKFHYLMKRIVYWYLKRRGYPVRAEELVSLIDDRNQFIGYIVPDVIAGDEYWEVETGYPSVDEHRLIMEPWDPFARLTWKLSKYEGSPSKIRVVFPAIYAYLFRDEIRKVRKYFKERGIDIQFYTIRLCGEGKLERFA